MAAVLLLGLLAAQWVAERLYQEEREKVVSHLISGPLGQRLNLVADKLERLPQLERPEMLQVLNSPRIRFVLAAEPLPDVTPKALQPLQARLGEVMGAKRAVQGGTGRERQRAGPIHAERWTKRHRDASQQQQRRRYSKPASAVADGIFFRHCRAGFIGHALGGTAIAGAGG